MKYSNSPVFFLFLSILLTINSQLLSQVLAQESNLSLRAPEESKEFEENNPSAIEVKKIPSFPNVLNKSSTAHKGTAAAALIPVNTRLRLSVDSFVDAKISMVGDYFRAHILEDFYVPTEPPQLIVPRGAWVRGRVSFLKRPNIFSMSGKIGLHLYQLVTPLGEIAPLNAELDVQQGIVNSQGLLDPMTNFKTMALEPTQALLESSQGRIVSIAALGTPVIGTLVAGTLTALFSQGDNITLTKGQELQILLKKDLQLTVN